MKSLSILVSISFLFNSIDIAPLLAQSQSSLSLSQKLATPSIWKPLEKEGYAISEELQFELLLGVRLLYKRPRFRRCQFDLKQAIRSEEEGVTKGGLGEEGRRIAVIPFLLGTHPDY